MSDDDFKMGQQGLRYSQGMNRQDYDRGKADKEDQDAAARNAPKGSVDGPGIVGIIMAPVLAIMYPVAGMIMTACIVAAALLIDLLPKAVGFGKFLLFLVAFVLALFPALKAEHKLSEYKAYRAFRSVFRIFWLGLLVVGLLIGADKNHDFDRALSNAPPSTLAWALAALALMLWLFPRFDRAFFPVRDAYAIKLEKKYAGMSDQEINESKQRISTGRTRFVATWLIGTVLMMMLIPSASVVPLAFGFFVLCFVFRKRLFYPKAPAVGSSS